MDAIVQIPAATDPPELLVRLVNATAAIGASASLFSAAIPEGGPEPSCLTLFACHPDYAPAQDGLGPILTHPWFRFARTHTIPGTDRQVRIEEGADQEAINLASQYGFRSCFIVPTPAGANLSHSFTSNPEEGNCVLVRNISGSPLLLTYWELYYVTGYWPLRSFEVIASPDYDHSDSKVEAHSTTTLRFTGADYFGWSAKALDGRRIFIKVFIAGRRDRLFKVYA
ncbi:hypothetical protein [Roseateles microcysteis]|uniref:hypothetical protein n=1 Tax=Roseateles microcysteis TaxID=3119057 RepID=UPI002FE627B0